MPNALLSLEGGSQRLKKNGYDGIEFAAEPYTIDQERMVSLLKKYEMECTSLCGIFPEGGSHDRPNLLPLKGIVLSFDLPHYLRKPRLIEL